MSTWVWLVVPVFVLFMLGFIGGFVFLVIRLVQRQAARADQVADAMTAATAPAPSLSQRLEEIDELYRSGRISTEERAAARAAILSQNPDSTY